MDDWDDEDEWPKDADEEGDVDVRPCPSCGAEVYEEAEQCPHCGEYIVWSTSAFSGKPLWWIILGLMGMVAVITTLTLI